MTDIGIISPSTRGERTRQAILDAAEELFLAQGYNGTSMRDIARQAGNIAVGGIYNHYPTKEDLFRALLKDRSPYDELLMILDQIEGSSGPAMLAEAVASIQALMRQHLGFIRLVMIDFQETGGASVRELLKTILPRIIKFFMRIQAAGGIRKDIEVFVLMRSVVSIMAGFILTGLVLYPDGRSHIPGMPDIGDERWQRAIIDILMNGLAQKEN